MNNSTATRYLNLTPDSESSGSGGSTPSSGYQSSSPEDNGERSGYAVFDTGTDPGRGFEHVDGPNMVEHTKLLWVKCDISKDRISEEYDFPIVVLHGNPNGHAKSLPEGTPEAIAMTVQLDVQHELSKDEMKSEEFKKHLKYATDKIKNLRWKRSVHLKVVLTDKTSDELPSTDVGAVKEIVPALIKNKGKIVSFGHTENVLSDADDSNSAI